MLIIVRERYDCRPYDPELLDIVNNIISALMRRGIMPSYQVCTELEEYIEKAARILKEIDDVSTAKIHVNSATEALVLRGIFRALGIHARVKLSERTTREQLEAARQIVDAIADITHID